MPSLYKTKMVKKNAISYKSIFIYIHTFKVWFLLVLSSLPKRRQTIFFLDFSWGTDKKALPLAPKILVFLKVVIS